MPRALRRRLYDTAPLAGPVRWLPTPSRWSGPARHVSHPGDDHGILEHL